MLRINRLSGRQLEILLRFLGRFGFGRYLPQNVISGLRKKLGRNWIGVYMGGHVGMRIEEEAWVG